ncbi:MAG: hypothetical protein LUH54_02850 [Firmicutes bacterium]|nr:hypothetical protein [Bacillota bacterium]
MTRKLNLTALILAFVMMITSCSADNKAEESETTDSSSTAAASRFLYTTEGKKLVRYDVVEHKEIVACPDPLCEHDTEDCPVSKISLVHITSEYIAFVKEIFDDETCELYLYDLSDGSIATIATGMSQIYYPWVSANRDYVFYTASVLLFDDNGNSTDEIWYAYRYNIESGELETINGNEKIATGYRVIEDSGNSLVWYDMLAGMYYTSDYDFGNFEEYDFIGETVCGYYIYSDIKWTEYDDYYRTVYKEDIESGEVEQILDNVSELRYDDIYSPSGIAYAGFNYNEEYGFNAKSEIWYYDFETGESRLLIDVKDISDDFDYVRIQNHAGYYDYAGGYIMVYIGHTYTYISEYDGEEYMSANSTHRLFINPETGDWFIMEPLY